MVGAARGEGFEHIESAQGAESILFDTRFFIDGAKIESRHTQLGMFEYTHDDTSEKLALTPC